MTEDNSTVSPSRMEHAQKYTFESESKLYEIEAQSETGREFQNLSTGPEKIKFLKANGAETKKETGGRTMLPQKGAWRFYNVGQLEYMFRADKGDDSDSDSPLEMLCKDIEGLEERKEFFHKNMTRIREWPPRIRREENLI